MSLIKLGLDNMTIPAKIQFGRQIVQNMTGNSNFLEPDPPLATVTGETDGTETAFNDARTARQVAKSKTTFQDEQVAGLDWTLQQLANYVEKVSDGDKAKIESAGLSVRTTPTPIGVPPAPTDVQVVPSERPGSADLSWKSDRGYRSFTVERAEDAPTPVYQVIGNTTKKAASFNSMVSGKKYWFRLASVSPAGQSAWSEPVALFAP